jgi:phospholipid/cholesterol/gamma-HCH transport system substrate-binding protein
VTNGARAVEGQGANFNAALDQAAGLTADLASQDQSLLDIVANIHQLAGTLDRRQQQLVKLIQDFSTVTGVLADERTAIGTFLSALARLINQGDALITKYQAQLPGDVATLTQFVMTVRVNADSAVQLLHSLNGASRLLIAAYDATNQGIVIRATLTPTVAAALQAAGLNNILTLLGLPPLSCIPALGVTC